MNYNEIKQILINSTESMLSTVMNYLPKLITAIVVLVVGYFIIKLIKYLLKKLLKISVISKFNDLISNVSFLKKIDFKLNVFILKFSAAILWTVLFIIISEILGLKVVSQEFTKIFNYLPKLFTALIIFGGGVYFSSILKTLIEDFLKSFGFQSLSFISHIAFYTLVMFIGVIALNHAGVETSIITNNIILIIGAVLMIFVISFGIGSINIVKDTLKMYYLRKNFKAGDIIIINNQEGEINKIDNNFVKIKIQDTFHFIPASEFYNSKVEIKA